MRWKEKQTKLYGKHCMSKLCDKNDFLSTCKKQGLVWNANMESNAVTEG
jgi:hypothetical protein